MTARLVRSPVCRSFVYRLALGPVVCSHTVEFGERGQCRLERSTQSAERRRLFLRDFVIERDDVPCTAGSRA
jgi:hypothetical protein